MATEKCNHLRWTCERNYLSWDTAFGAPGRVNECRSFKPSEQE